MKFGIYTFVAMFLLLLVAFFVGGPLPYIAVPWVTAGGAIAIMAGMAYISFPEMRLADLEAWRTPSALVQLSVTLGFLATSLCKDVPTGAREKNTPTPVRDFDCHI